MHHNSIEGRVIQSRSINHTSGYDNYTSLYSGLTNRVLTIDHEHSAKFAVIYNQTEKVEYSYDHFGRLIEEKYTVGTSIPQIARYSYNDLGCMYRRFLTAENGGAQSLDYKYNIRGWLTKINNPDIIRAVPDLFGMNIYYNVKDEMLANEELFSGNISGMKWQTAQPTGLITPVTSGVKGYRFKYDGLNRVLEGNYGEISSGNFVYNEKYTEKIINSQSNNSYDLNSNMLGLTRYGLRGPNNNQGTIDELTYSYKGNQLVGVDDQITTDFAGKDFKDNGSFYNSTVPEFGYDANGNLIFDKNKNVILIEYNSLNLPQSIDMGQDGRIDYQYDAVGKKLKQVVYESGIVNKQTDFIGNFVYQDGKPSWVLHANGRIIFGPNRTYYPETYLKDHLGNVRVAYTFDGVNNNVNQVDSYYPFGMNIKELSANSATSNLMPNKYLFNGKLVQDELGLNWLDFGARFYDGVVGRWWRVDPLAGNAPSWTPYRFGFNNPIRYFDPDGQWEWDANGNLVAQKGDQSYSLAKFLGTSQKNAMTMLNRSGVTANDKGILNLKVGQQLSKDNLWVGTKSGSGPVVNDTKEATAHYFNGNGQAADVGDQSTRELLSSDKFQEKHTKITTQKVQAEGNFSVDLTVETFHIGRTNVDYSVGGNGKSSSVTYTLFSRDGFWDPNFVAEKTLGKVFNRYKPDGMGPNLEQPGGTPYPYKTRERTFFFKPVEE